MEIFVEVKSRIMFFLNYYRMNYFLEYVAHHGIQRSGTNYLNTILMRSGVNVINKYDPKRSDPRHKHCRWFSKKDRIYLDEQYCNNFHAETVEELNNICGYKKGTRHLVIYRNPKIWLNGIYRWAIRSGWIDENCKEDELIFFLKGAYLEWKEYYGWWLSISEKNPKQVIIVSHERLVAADKYTLENIESFLEMKSKINPKIDKVSKSRAGFSKKDPKLEKLCEQVVGMDLNTNLKLNDILGNDW